MEPGALALALVGHGRAKALRAICFTLVLNFWQPPWLELEFLIECGRTRTPLADSGGTTLTVDW